MFLLSTLATMTAASTGSDFHRAEITYRLGSQFEGASTLDCAAASLDAVGGGPGSWTVASRGGTYRADDVRFNISTLILPNGGEHSVRVTTELDTLRENVSAGVQEIQWGTGGRVKAFATPGPFSRETHTFRLKATVDHFAIERPQSGVPTVVFYDAFEGQVLSKFGHHEAPVRRSTFGNGTLTFGGDLTLYVENVVLKWGDVERSLPQRVNESVVVDAAGAAEHRYIRVRFGFLLLQDAAITIPATDAIAQCQELHGALHGRLDVFDAQGRLHADDQATQFQQQELTLEGAFLWADSPDEGGTHGSAMGSFDAVGLDFVRVYEAPARPSLLVSVGFWAGVLAAAAALGWAFTKFALPFFSRLTQAEVVGHDSRNRLLDAVRLAPNINLHTLAQRTGLSKSEVRYHARILETRGLLRSHKVHRDRCYVAKETIQSLGRSILDPTVELLAQNDPLVGAIHRESRRASLRLRDLLEKVSTEFGVSRIGAWKAVRRAEKYGLVHRRRIGQGVWVTCVDS